MINKQLPIVFSITAGSQPANGIILSHRSEGQHEQELLLLLIGQAHDDIVGLHKLFCAEIELSGYSPQVFLVVEYPGIFHVVGLVYLSLDIEEILRITEVDSQRFGHLLCRDEELGEDGLVSPYQSILRVSDIESDTAIVGINNCFNAIANIV
ncbi:hypothetical protein ES703_65811 [subsurface metagenome]